MKYLGRMSDRHRGQYSFTRLLSTPPVEINGGETVLHGLSDSQLKFQNFWNYVLWNSRFEF